MNLGDRACRRTAGYLLVEYLVYIVVLALIMEIALSAFYRCLDNSRDLARTTEDMLRVLRVGEVWRSDLRAATAPPRLVRDGRLTAFEIPTGQSLVVYAFGDGAVWRKAPDAEPKQVLPRVAACQMIADQGRHVASWRWELELASKKKHVRLHPLFTFEAVTRSFSP